jgi:hypothetical protein
MVMVSLSRDPPFKVGLFVLGSFVVAYNAQHFLHECGHLFSGLLCGAHSFVVEMHPFSWSYAWADGATNGAFVSWGGVLWSNLAALITFAISYRYRSARLFPLVLWSSFAFLGNGTYLILGTLLDTGDADSLMWYGVPGYLLVILGAISTLAGLAAVLIACAALRLHEYNRLTAMQMLALPVVPYLAVMVILAAGRDRRDLLLYGAYAVLGVAAGAALGALSHRVGGRLRPPKAHTPISWLLVVVVNIVGIAAVAAQFALLSE